MGRNRELLINPTLACGNFLNCRENLDILVKVGNTVLHLDVMDGHYVPNLCFNLDQIRTIRENYPFLLDVHLMVTNPENYIPLLDNAGADYVSFHLDASSFPIRLIRQIQEAGMKAGVVLNPSQSAALLSETLAYADYILLMGVEPGFSGQSFLPGTVDKIRELDRIRRERGYPYLLEVDGGIDDENSLLCLEAGADILVSGAFGVFRNRDGLERDYLAFREHLETALNADNCKK